MQVAPTSDRRPSWEAPAQLIIAVIAAPVLLMAIFASSIPGIEFGLALIASSLFFFVVAPAWALSFALAAWKGRGFRDRALIRWLSVPMASLLCLVLVATNIPLKLRFEASRSAFDAAVRDGYSTDGGQIGLYWIDRVSEAGDGVPFFVTRGGGFMEECGLAHSPGRNPATHQFDSARDLGGGWWELCLYFD
jgi:hypothetical protein